MYIFSQLYVFVCIHDNNSINCPEGLSHWPRHTGEPWLVLFSLFLLPCSQQGSGAEAASDKASAAVRCWRSGRQLVSSRTELSVEWRLRWHHCPGHVTPLQRSSSTGHRRHQPRVWDWWETLHWSLLLKVLLLQIFCLYFRAVSWLQI